ncbi:MAG TPA: phosphoribosylaminoimidazolesuccinocarboxamide synthase [Pelomicrobium sp.]|nr:phosphoribosylaminoimidazolesuccinocarboxamide synthase [Pelomicrobium sp.]
MSASDQPLFTSSVTSLPFLHRGKVRDIYAVDDDKLLIIQTDRLSAFDVILPTPVPGKGKVLTALSRFWFDRLRHVIPNHMTDIAPESVVTDRERAQVEGRAFVVKRLRPLPIEAVVRGYIAGSGWKDYQRTGAVCGIPLPAGLAQAQQLPEPIFTPATKAPSGEHDENIPYERMAETVGWGNARKVRDAALTLYREAAAYAAERGILIADTKFEFGLEDGQVVLIDEALTPDSSRFWPAAEYRTGISPPSFDKQFVRDWLETQPWDKRAPAPALPSDILEKTAAKYREALRLLTG